MEEGPISAYAKIAGRDWTYYVKETEITIGRPPDGSSKQVDFGTQSSPASKGIDLENVHIDLGPHKSVSRLHALLSFDQSDEKWCLRVNGRNGVRINETALKREQQFKLTSGDVIEIAGTEMMFVTAEHPALIHKKYRDRLIAPPVKEEEAEPFSNQAHAHPISTYYAEASLASQTRSYPRQPAIAPAPSSFARPVTPVRSPTRPANITTRSPAFGGRGVMMQSNEQINYASDAVSDIKPGCSYATLIGQAILSTSEEMLTLAGIYDWIKDHFSYYRNNANAGWQVC